MFSGNRLNAVTGTGGLLTANADNPAILAAHFTPIGDLALEDGSSLRCQPCFATGDILNIEWKADRLQKNRFKSFEKI